MLFFFFNDVISYIIIILGLFDLGFSKDSIIINFNKLLKLELFLL